MITRFITTTALDDFLACSSTFEKFIDLLCILLKTVHPSTRLTAHNTTKSFPHQHRSLAEFCLPATHQGSRAPVRRSVRLGGGNGSYDVARPPMKSASTMPVGVHCSPVPRPTTLSGSDVGHQGCGINIMLIRSLVKEPQASGWQLEAHSTHANGASRHVKLYN
jgi:hypothetical protein